MRKLNASLENLLFNNDMDGVNGTIDHRFVEEVSKKMELDKAKAGLSGERKRAGSTVQNELPLGKKIKLESHKLRIRKPRN